MAVPVDPVDELEPVPFTTYAAHLHIDTDCLTEDEVKEAIEVREAELDLLEEAEAWLGIVADVEGR